MTNKAKILGIIEVVGLTLVVLAAALWVLPQDNTRLMASNPRELTMRRLYHQRVFGIVALILSTVLMWLPVGFYAGMYVGKTSWLIPFVFFVVVEVYTVFRISAVEKG